MSDLKSFRVVLDLSRYFGDHRRIARIFIKSHLRTIENLQAHISQIFGIQNYYLTSGGHYLPLTEDIRVLSSDETICAVPEQENVTANVSTSFSPKIVNKQYKRTFEDISEVPNETSPTPQKKKAKKYYNKSSHNSDNETQVKQSKKNKKNEEYIKSLQEGINTRENNISEIKKRIKENVDKYNKKYCNGISENTEESIYNIKTKLQNYKEQSKPDTVRLSRHVDTPFKSYKKYMPPQMITKEYLEKRNCNIIKIDVLNEDNSIEICGASCNEKIQEESPPKNYVKNVIESLEKKMSPNEKESNLVIEKESSKICFPTVKNENISLDSTNINPSLTTSKIETTKSDNFSEMNQNKIPITNSDNLLLNNIVADFCNSLKSSNTEKEHNNSFASDVTIANFTSETSLEVNLLENTLSDNVLTESSKSRVSLETRNYSLSDNDISKSVIPKSKDQSTLEEIDFSINENLKSEDTSKKSVLKCTSNKIAVGVSSSMLCGTPVDSSMEDNNTSDTSSQFVTKRKRIRTRNKKIRKKKLLEPEENEFLSTPANLVYSSPSVHQGLHIRFEQEPINSEEIIKKDSSHTAESLIDENIFMENKWIFGNDSILRAPLMNNLKPKAGDVIAFKILKMGENYNPQISNYIIGKVDAYDAETEKVDFFILLGSEELAPPTSGKLWLDLEENEENLKNNNHKDFFWKELLEPKLLYP